MVNVLGDRVRPAEVHAARARSLALALLLSVPFTTFAQHPPDFSGVWTLEESKSDPLPAGRGGRGLPGLGGPVTIKQSPTEIAIGLAVYKLDGTATTIEGRGGVATARARWEGTSLLIETSRDIQGMSVTSREVRSLSSDGQEMTVVTTTTTPQGTLSRKSVYTKS